MLSKDDQLRHNYLEIAALLRSGTYAFLLTSGNLTGVEMARAFVEASPQIRGIASSLQPPLVATVSKCGKVRVAYTHDTLLGQALEARDAEQRRRSPKGR